MAKAKDKAEMTVQEKAELIVDNTDIKNMIHVVRGQQVMLDSDLALLYQVETKRLNERVKRNISRFPESFCFQLTKEEYNYLRSQIATSSGNECFGISAIKEPKIADDLIERLKAIQ